LDGSILVRRRSVRKHLSAGSYAFRRMRGGQRCSEAAERFAGSRCDLGIHSAAASNTRRVFAIDLSICPDCGGRLRVIADVTRPDIIEKILEHVARQQAPPEFSTISSMATVH